MKKLTWIATNPLQDKSSINKLEEQVGVALPTDFVDYVLKFNGGVPSLVCFLTKNKTEHVLNNLIPFNEDDDNSVFDAYQILFDRRGNYSLIPFGDDPFGNFICFLFSTDKNVRIVYWQHETNTIEEVCDTFSEFISKLYQGED